MKIPFTNINADQFAIGTLPVSLIISSIENETFPEIIQRCFWVTIISIVGATLVAWIWTQAWLHYQHKHNSTQNKKD